MFKIRQNRLLLIFQQKKLEWNIFPIKWKNKNYTKHKITQKKEI